MRLRSARHRLWPTLPPATMMIMIALAFCLALMLSAGRAAPGRAEATAAPSASAEAEALRLYRENDRLRRLSDTPNHRGGGRDADLLRRWAGLTALRGPGVRVTLRDSDVPVEANFDQSAYTVHDQDLLLIVNELWAAGAEAMAVNRQRLVTTSEVRCTGPVININRVSIAPPYEVAAIGDPDSLAGALEGLRGGIVDQLRSVGITVRIAKSTDVVVPPLDRDPQFRYARPTVWDKRSVDPATPESADAAAVTERDADAEG